MRGALILILALILARAASAEEPNYNYALHCTGCHTAEGVSPPLGRVPPLRDVVGHFARNEETRLYLVNVPGIVNSGLDAKDTAALLNWIVEVFGGASTPDTWTRFDAAEVTALRAKAPSDIMAYRKEVEGGLKAAGFSVGSYP